MKIPLKYIIEIGLLRKNNLCALCKKKVDVSAHHIQLCYSCRGTELDKFIRKQEDKFKQADSDLRKIADPNFKTEEEKRKEVQDKIMRGVFVE